MATTVFESPTAVGAKVFTITTTVTNTSGAYTSTINDERVTAAMKAIKLELGTPSVFDDKISVVCNNGSMTISCNSVAGTSTVAVSIIKACEDPTEVTSAEFDVLANRIGSLTNLTTTEKTTVVGAINEVGYTTSTKQDATDNNLSTTAKTVVGAINENASGITSNSEAIANLQVKPSIQNKYIDDTSKTSLAIIQNEFSTMKNRETRFMTIRPSDNNISGFITRTSEGSYASGVFYEATTGKYYKITNINGTWTKEELVTKSTLTDYYMESRKEAGAQPTTLNGFHGLTYVSTVEQGAPVEYCIILSFSVASYAVQFAFQANQTKMWIRTGSSSGSSWTSWKQIST